MRKCALLFISLIWTLSLTARSQAETMQTRKSDQRKALIALYKATGGKGWIRREGWCSSKALGNGRKSRTRFNHKRKISERNNHTTDERPRIHAILLWSE